MEGGHAEAPQAQVRGLGAAPPLEQQLPLADGRVSESAALLLHPSAAPSRQEDQRNPNKSSVRGKTSSAPRKRSRVWGPLRVFSPRDPVLCRPGPSRHGPAPGTVPRSTRCLGPATPPASPHASPQPRRLSSAEPLKGREKREPTGPGSAHLTAAPRLPAVRPPAPLELRAAPPPQPYWPDAPPAAASIG